MQPAIDALTEYQERIAELEAQTNGLRAELNAASIYRDLLYEIAALLDTPTIDSTAEIERLIACADAADALERENHDLASAHDRFTRQTGRCLVCERQSNTFVAAAVDHAPGCVMAGRADEQPVSEAV